MTILSGALGQKRRIHIHVGKVLDTEIDAIKADNDSSNKAGSRFGTSYR
jgi:hypothetical protein